MILSEINVSPLNHYFLFFFENEKERDTVLNEYLWMFEDVELEHFVFLFFYLKIRRKRIWFQMKVCRCLKMLIYGEIFAPT